MLIDQMQARVNTVTVNQIHAIVILYAFNGVLKHASKYIAGSGILEERKIKIAIITMMRMTSKAFKDSWPARVWPTPKLERASREKILTVRNTVQLAYILVSNAFEWYT